MPYRFIEKDSLANKYPLVAAEWNYEKNVNLIPHNISYGSNKMVWWKCKNGHEWESRVYNRSHGKSCPYCCNQKVNLENCLATTNPLLAQEWNFSKNGELTPYMVARSSNKSVWWKCKVGHEW